MLPYLVERPREHAPLPERRRQAGVLAQGAAATRSRMAAALAQRATLTPARPRSTWWSTRPPALAWAANYGAVELHPWTSTIADHPHQPTWAMIDIDPGESSTFDDVVMLARLHRTALDHLGVRGDAEGHRQARHPDLGPGRRRADVRRHTRDGSSGCRASSATSCRRWSVGSGRVAKRGGRIRLDYTQNAINKTLVAPFSARPAAGAPVSVPITWDELDDPDLRPDRWTIRTIGERLASKGDPLAPLIGLQQRLPNL